MIYPSVLPTKLWTFQLSEAIFLSFFFGFCTFVEIELGFCSWCFEADTKAVGCSKLMDSANFEVCPFV